MDLLKRLYEEASAGTGSLSDLGEPPAMGLNTSTGRKKLRKGFVPTRSVSESEDMAEDPDLTPEETVETDEGPEVAPVYGKDTPGAVDPNADPGAMDPQTAKSILDAPTGMKKEEEEEEGPPKAQMQRVLQFLVSKPTRNTHSKPTPPVDISKPWMIRGQLQIGEGFTSRVFRETFGKNQPNDAKAKMVIGIITKTRDRYIFTTDVLAGGSDRNFVFEGDRVKMKALLTILKATMRDMGGGADAALNEVDTRVSPVEIVVSRDLLLTDGVKYVEQIVVQ